MGCGKCCTKPNIDATILEFLPLAMHYYLEGTAEHKLQELEEGGAICHTFKVISEETGRGYCGLYGQRGLICRLFGASVAMKKGVHHIYTCKLIKESQAGEFEKTSSEIKQKNFAPVVSDYYRQLANIDSDLARQYYPINIAVQKALEFILHFYAYRRPPRLKKIA